MTDKLFTEITPKIAILHGSISQITDFSYLYISEECWEDMKDWDKDLKDQTEKENK